MNAYEISICDRMPDEMYDLYDETCGLAWPLHMDRFLSVGYRKCIVALIDSHVVGGVIVDAVSNIGYVQFIGVKNAFQNNGIGSALICSAEKLLSNLGIDSVFLGRGRGYIWQGVPQGQKSWFLQKGYWIDEMSIDMILERSNFDFESISNLNRLEGISIELMNNNDSLDLLETISKSDIKDWYGFYENMIDNEKYNSIMLTRKSSIIVGFVILLEKNMIWEKLFSGKVGGLACLGVCEQYRGQGIGMALATEATCELFKREIDISYLAWTWLEDWYKKIGYEKWRTYSMMHKKL